MLRHALILILTLMVSLAAAIRSDSEEQYLDLGRGLQNYQAILRGEKEFTTLSETEKREVIEIMPRMERQKDESGPLFKVVHVISGCKYFLVEQGANYSLVEPWLCFKPRKGAAGYGDVSSYGIKEVELNGIRCSLYVTDWLLSKSRALEKLIEKCE